MAIVPMFRCYVLIRANVCVSSRQRSAEFLTFFWRPPEYRMTWGSDICSAAVGKARAHLVVSLQVTVWMPPV